MSSTGRPRRQAREVEKVASLEDRSGATPQQRKTFTKILAREGVGGGGGSLEQFLEEMQKVGVNVAIMRCTNSDQYGGKVTPIAKVILQAVAGNLSEAEAVQTISVLRCFGQDPNELSPNNQELPTVLACFHGLHEIVLNLFSPVTGDGGEKVCAPAARIDGRASTAIGTTCLGACMLAAAAQSGRWEACLNAVLAKSVVFVQDCGADCFNINEDFNDEDPTYLFYAVRARLPPPVVIALLEHGAVPNLHIDFASKFCKLDDTIISASGFRNCSILWLAIYM